MEIKKSEKADLEKRKSFFMEIGLVCTLGILLFAFEWKSYDAQNVQLSQRQGAHIEEDVMIQTEQNTPPPPPPPPTPELSTEIEIVEDTKVIKNEVEINSEVNEKTIITPYVAPKIEEAVVVEEEIFQIVEENPAFPGGDEARIKFLQDNLKYPVVAMESGIQGTVHVTFVVEKDGSITDVKVLRGIGGGCDEEAIRVVKNMPKWNPGKQRGKPVRVQYRVPIRFNLN